MAGSLRMVVLAPLLIVPACRTPNPSRATGPEVVFNQHVLEAAWDGRGHDPRPARAVRPRGSDASGVDFESPRAVLRFVLRHAPQPAIVYPTERYYYYRFPLGSRIVSGNLRFVDAEVGAISVGYFDALNTSDMRVGTFRNGEDGVEVAWDEATSTVRLTLEGVSRDFVLDTCVPRAPAFPLMDGEQFIAGVRDESGYAFSLMYWPPDRSFYYVLDPREPRPEAWVRSEEAAVPAWFGVNSRFCFLHHDPSGRDILVGVHRSHIADNTWFDGPFDQVPPRLHIGDLLREAYPYVDDAGGIDDHGNFLALEGQRVAIAPYRTYSSGAQLVRELSGLVDERGSPAAWTRATYEYKKDWRAPAVPESHEAALSRTWPANHWTLSSGRWPADHAQALSPTWPPRHVPE